MLSDLVRILTNRNNAQRQSIADAYHKLTQKVHQLHSFSHTYVHMQAQPPGHHHGKPTLSCPCLAKLVSSTSAPLQDLSLALKKALSGGLEDLMLGLMMTPAQFDAHRLRQTMEVRGMSCVCVCLRRGFTLSHLQQYEWVRSHVGVLWWTCLTSSWIACVSFQGLGTDEEGLLEVLCSKSPQQLRDITIAYKQGETHTHARRCIHTHAHTLTPSKLTL